MIHSLITDWLSYIVYVLPGFASREINKLIAFLSQSKSDRLVTKINLISKGNAMDSNETKSKQDCNSSWLSNYTVVYS